MAAETQGSASWTYVPCMSVKSPGPPSEDACPHPARPTPRPCAAGQSLHETVRGRTGPILGTLRWTGNPKTSPTALLACDAVKEIAQQGPISSVRPPNNLQSLPSPQRATSQARSSSITAATPRQSSAQMPMWEKQPAVWCTRTHQTCTLVSSKKKPGLPEHEVPEPEDVHEEAPISALRIVYGDGLRRIPSVR